MTIVDSRPIEGVWKHFPTTVGHLEIYVSKGWEIGRVFRECDHAPIACMKFFEHMPVCETIEQAKAIVMARYVSLHN